MTGGGGGDPGSPESPGGMITLLHLHLHLYLHLHQLPYHPCSHRAEHLPRGLGEAEREPTSAGGARARDVRRERVILHGKVQDKARREMHHAFIPRKVALRTVRATLL